MVLFFRDLTDPLVIPLVIALNWWFQIDHMPTKGPQSLLYLCSRSLIIVRVPVTTQEPNKYQGKKRRKNRREGKREGSLVWI